MAAVAIRGLGKDAAGQEGLIPILHNVSLDVADGELLVLVGPSGCGKSTLLRCVAGLESIERGEVQLDGRRINELAPGARDVAMVFQSYALYPHLTVRENLAFPLRLRKEPESEIAARVAEALELTGISALVDRRPSQLSGGQRQRVAIGRALVRRPRLFLFDEPLSNLDASLRARMRVELKRLHARLRATMIYVTHDQVEAMTLADRIAVMRSGQVEQVGTPRELYDRPANLFVARFLGTPEINLVPAEALGVVGATTLGLRPEDIYFEDRGPLAGTVELVEELGRTSIVHLLVGDQRIVALVESPQAPQPGVVASFRWDPERLHRFDQHEQRIA